MQYVGEDTWENDQLGMGQSQVETSFKGRLPRAMHSKDLDDGIYKRDSLVGIVMIASI